MIRKLGFKCNESEAIVGIFLRYRMSDSIMGYTPTMLERAQIYSGKHQDDPLDIIIPKKDYIGSVVVICIKTVTFNRSWCKTNRLHQLGNCNCDL